MADLRLKKFEPSPEPSFFKKTGEQFALSVETATDDADVFQLHNERAHLGPDSVLDRRSDAARDFFWMNCEKQATAQLGSRSDGCRLFTTICRGEQRYGSKFGETRPPLRFKRLLNIVSSVLTTTVLLTISQNDVKIRVRNVKGA